MSIIDGVEVAAPPVQDRSRAPFTRWAFLWIWLGFTAVVLLEARGLIVRDTELGVDVAPLQWIASAVHLWDPSAFSGSVQIEKFGYLLPMAPFFALGQLLHVPVWITERIWLSSLLAIGAWGVIRLSEQLGQSRRWPRVLGAVVYCTAPIVIDWSSLSVDLLAVAFLPWVLLPLIKGSKDGSPRRMAARSGVAVALMGGVNATVILAVLPLAIVWLVTRAPGPRRRALMGWWVISLGLACFWWFAGAALQGKYGYNYLPYTETAVNTTSTASLFESLRGTSDWLNYYRQNGGVVPTGGYLLVSSPIAVLGTAIVAGLGLAGLSLKRVPERVFLVSGVVIGAVAMASGYRGAGSGLFSHTVLSVLTQPLAFLRNISKLSPEVTLPLAIGLILLVTSLLDLWDRRDEGTVRTKSWLAGAVVVAALVGTVGACLPILRNQLYPSGGFAAIPAYWDQTAQWLERHQGRQSALLVPGAPFATYRWGNTQDEPLSVLTRTSVTMRTIVPFGSDGNTQMLSAVEDSVDTGTPQPGLARYLSRSGIDYVVERNTLDSANTGAPPAAQVHQVLANTPGLRRVAAFGPYVPNHSTHIGILPVFETGAAPRLRAVEIYMVRPKAQEVRTSPAATPVVVSGSPSSLVALSGTSALDGRAAILAKDGSATRAAALPTARWALTDGNQRRVLKFGKLHDNASYLLGAGQILRGGNSVNALSFGYGASGSPASQTTSSPIGVSQLGYSAISKSFAVGSFVVAPFGPSSAFDDNPETEWVPNLGPVEAGESVGARLSRPTYVRKVAITPVVDSPQRSLITAVQITTDQGKVTTSIPPRAGTYWVRAVPGMTSKVWVTIKKVQLGIGTKTSLLGPGIATVVIPGVNYQPTMALPTDELLHFSAPDRRSPTLSFDDPVANLNFDFYAPQTTPAAWNRKVVVPNAASASITGAAVANTGQALSQLVERVATPSDSPLSVSASSTLRDLPSFRAQNLVESSSHPWIAGLGDAHPTVHLRWKSLTTIDSINVVTTPTASRPTSLLISTGTERRVVAVSPSGGLITFDPITTDSIDVTIRSSSSRYTKLPIGSALVSSQFEFPTLLPPGLRSLTVPAIDPALIAPVPSSTALTLPCGQGPTVTVDERPVPTRLVGTVGDLETMTPVRYEACGQAEFSAGRNVVSFPATGAFRAMTMSTAGTLPSVPKGARHATIVSWGNDSRTIRLSAGSSTYLQVSQNANPGWVATLDGKTLTPAVLEGWQQAWIVPAGAAGTVTMSFAPQSTFQDVLLFGLVLLVLLALLALFARAGADKPSLAARRPYPTWLLVAIAVVATAAISKDGLVLLVAVLPVAWWRRSTSTMAFVAGGAFVLAGLYVARHPETDFLLSNGAFSLVTQLLSVIALLALMGATIAAERLRGRQVLDDATTLHDDKS